MSPCPYMAQQNRQRHQRPNKSKHSQLAWVRGPEVHQPTSLWSFLANTFFPRRSAITLHDNQRKRNQVQKKPNQRDDLRRRKDRNDNDGEFLQWCSHCHQHHPLGPERKDRQQKARAEPHVSPARAAMKQHCSCYDCQSILRDNDLHRHRMNPPRPVPFYAHAAPRPVPGPWAPVGPPYPDGDDNSGIHGRFVHSFFLRQRRNAVVEEISPLPMVEYHSRGRGDVVFNDWVMNEAIHGEWDGEDEWTMSGALRPEGTENSILGGVPCGW